MHGGYTIDQPLLQRITAAAHRRDADAVWDLLDEHGRLVEPLYTYPPFLLSMAAEQVREGGLRLVSSALADVRSAMERCEIELLLAAGAAEAGEFLVQLRRLSLDDATLSRRFEELIGEPWDAAVPALREAVGFLAASLETASRTGSTALVLLG